MTCLNPTELSELADLLNSDGINYSVFLAAYRGAASDTLAAHDIVKRLLDKDVVLDGLRDVDVAEVAETVDVSLRYAGDAGAGPGLAIFASKRFDVLLRGILAEIAKLGETSERIKSFTFVAGHPAYPVFWDFAFLFLCRAEAVLLVGSSSD